MGNYKADNRSQNPFEDAVKLANDLFKKCMKLFRKEALLLFAYIELMYMSLQDRENILLDVYSDNDEYLSIKDSLSPEYNIEIVNYLIENFRGLLSDYLEKKLTKFFACEVVVIGNEEELFRCPCCEYRTLETIGQYLICKVCFWENDGIIDDNEYSSVNHMSLKEAKENFMLEGVIDNKFKKFIASDVKERYGR